MTNREIIHQCVAAHLAEHGPEGGIIMLASLISGGHGTEKMAQVACSLLDRYGESNAETLTKMIDDLSDVEIDLAFAATRSSLENFRSDK